MSKAATTKTARKPTTAEGACVCGAVRFEIDVPAVWAWHDHGATTRHAHGAAYATYVGTWRSRLRVTEGEDNLSRYENAETRTARSFCTTCGTPVFYERPRAPKMVNIPRALFASRTGREPRYHLNLTESADWEYRGEPLGPLKGFPGVQWERPKRKKPREPGGML
ncbi:hypothetical protein sos41_34460 [Alphaproteobacteria bacterium SO-S41]|nr:hypothetical protein sos41_34460 [Alphaproteobacteria bacterium SO-S41]